MTDIQTIAFSKLVASDTINARGATKEGIDELAASIAAKGLIQPLAVRPADGGKFEVIDGRRRHAALAKLIKGKTLKKDHPVPVLVRNEDDAEALETSLMANTVRLPMHPVDQHEVFARLADQGKSDADIAAAFGIAEKTVRQHKALGKLAPVVREAWKKGKIDRETAQAFTLHADHEVQAATFEKLKKSSGGHVTEWSVRSELSGKREAVTESPEMIFVGEEAYAAAGGTISESLFSDERMIDDVPLLKKLARDKLQAECDRLLAEGWSWAALAEDLPQRYPNSWLNWKSVENEAANSGDYDPNAWTAQQRAASGCAVEVDGDGAILITPGIIRPDGAAADASVDDSGAEDEAEDATDDLGDDENDEPLEVAAGDAFAVSGALTQSITTAQTEAVASVVGQDFEIALRLALAGLMSRDWSSPVKITVTSQAQTAPDKIEFAKVFARVSQMTYGDAMAEFTRVIAGAVSCVEQLNVTSPADGTRVLVAALKPHLYLGYMREAFNAADYFKRASKETALAALEEIAALGTYPALSPDLPRALKAHVAALAAQRAAETGWLPPQLRHPAYTLIDLGKKDAAE